MLESLEQDVLLADFLQQRAQHLRECSIRRTVQLLEAKRRRIREELEQLIGHIALLVPLTGAANNSTESHSQLLRDAVEQLGDEAFAQLLLQVLQEINVDG